MKTACAIALSTFLLCSCAPPQPDIAQVRKAIEAITEKSEKDMLNGTIDSTMSQYTEDAISMPNFEPIIRGKEGLKESYKKMAAMGVKFPKVEFTTTDVQVGGAFAYEIGTYNMVVQMPGVPDIPSSGKYLTVYERAADGSWKIKVETWNSDAMPSMPMGEKEKEKNE
jgi:ketosteroid isomerase-like protein